MTSHQMTTADGTMISDVICKHCIINCAPATTVKLYTITIAGILSNKGMEYKLQDNIGRKMNGCTDITAKKN